MWGLLSGGQCSLFGSVVVSYSPYIFPSDRFSRPSGFYNPVRCLYLYLLDLKKRRKFSFRKNSFLKMENYSYIII
ncbi:MAG: hypothetical protein DRP96_05965 [Candidatus Neomarinimicrobiota bacterium]|nr:MAG: hypothetical protein DRP96_05965 [Candidatus Neomarinimicrobiota bacterium]